MEIDEELSGDLNKIGSRDSSKSKVLPLALHEGRLLEVLATKLTNYLPQPDIQMILDDLRSELYVGLDLGSIKTLHSITKNCRKCPNLIPDPQLPAWNKVDPDCLFVLDMPPQSKDMISFIVKALTDAGFSSKRVCLTYVNRCASKAYKATFEEIDNCLDYLLTEIQLLRPKLIVPMGVIPASVVLNTQIKMADERGRVLFLGPFAVMPVYSPSYVLRPESTPTAGSTFAQDMKYAFKYCYGEHK